ncbi:toll/interleukin-1 receptor domain-containing protein [Actinomadura sp. WMMA1423]|uniref:toll/interleukin-1 receptor domain-containing protein n=1 Tax=Actinomadura sp. WMMA1423 TaxID=2591108 RepID=UPI00143DDB4A|nr:toll/interleukin-1 receptor domain-containing protein [Actinomadura sp. WMMA1423]
MPRFFVNYRSGDTEHVAALVERELSSRFGTEVFFRASKSIPAGDDFTQVLRRAVRQSDALLSFIGPHWWDTDGDGRRKIDRDDDWPRLEIAEAFRHGVRVIPILVGAVDPPRARDLPADLARLAVCQYVRLGHRNQDADMDLLVAQLMKLVPELEESAGDESETSTGASGGFVNNAKGDVNIGFQADNVRGGVRLGDIGGAGRRRAASGEKDTQ